MKKFKTKEIVALIIIGVLMLATIIGGGFFIVNNVNEANNKLNQTNSTVSEDVTLETKESTTQVEGEEVTVAENEKTTEKTKATEKDDKNKKETQATTKKKTDNDKKETKATKATENKSNDNKDAIQVVVPETNATHSSKQVLKVNGVDCYVGDTITVTLNMQTPEVLMNFQGYTKYDDKYLKFVSIEKNVGGSSYVNDHESCIYYNGSDIMKGYDFTGKGTLYTAKFKVLKKGNTGIVNEIEVLTDMNEKVVHPKDAVINIGIYN